MPVPGHCYSWVLVPSNVQENGHCKHFWERWEVIYIILQHNQSTICPGNRCVFHKPGFFQSHASLLSFLGLGQQLIFVPTSMWWPEQIAVPFCYFWLGSLRAISWAPSDRSNHPKWKRTQSIGLTCCTSIKAPLKLPIVPFAMEAWFQRDRSYISNPTYYLCIASRSWRSQTDPNSSSNPSYPYIVSATPLVWESLIKTF